MITLSTPPQVLSVLGGTTKVNYDKMVIDSNRMNAIDRTVNANLRFSSSANPDMQPINGNLLINAQTRVLEVRVEQLDFYRRVILTQSQADAAVAIIAGAQNDLEQGLLSLGVTLGVHTAGV